QPRRGVRSEDGVGLVADVDHPDTACLGAHQDRRNVAAAQREQRLDAGAAQYLRDAVATVTRLAHRAPAGGGVACFGLRGVIARQPDTPPARSPTPAGGSEAAGEAEQGGAARGAVGALVGRASVGTIE